MPGLIRRLWVWAFGPGDFAGAFFWTLAIVLLFLALAVLALAMPLAFLGWVLA